MSGMVSEDFMLPVNLNESGVDCLNILAQNQLARTNTWFPKRDIHLQT